MTAGFEQHLAQYRDLRRQLEENVLGLATSIDGRRFEFQASLYATGLGPGSYVMILPAQSLEPAKVALPVASI